MTCVQFAEAFRDQFTAERLEYMDEIEDAVRNIVDERYKKGQGPSGTSNNAELPSLGGRYCASFRLDLVIYLQVLPR